MSFWKIIGGLVLLDRLLDTGRKEKGTLPPSLDDRIEDFDEIDIDEIDIDEIDDDFED